MEQERTRKILFSNEFYNSQNFLTFFRICECEYTVCEMTQYPVSFVYVKCCCAVVDQNFLTNRVSKYYITAELSHQQGEKEITTLHPPPTGCEMLNL